MDKNMVKEKARKLKEVREMEKVWKSERQHFLQNPVSLAFAILFFISMDGLTLYTVFELLMRQKPLLLIVITAVIAAVLNISPMFIASCLRNAEMRSQMKMVLITLLLSVFVVLFAMTLWLRWESASMLFEDNNSTNMLSFSDEADQILADDEEDLYEGTHKAMALLMGLEPLATSVCSFYLSYEQDPKQKRNRQVKRSIMTLQAMVDSMEKNREELLMDAAYDRDAYDLEDYENTKRIVEARCEGHYVASRRMLAEHEGSPEAVYYELETCEVRISDGLESEPYGQMTRRIPLGPDDIVSMDNRHLGEKAVEEGNSRSGVA